MSLFVFMFVLYFQIGSIIWLVDGIPSEFIRFSIEQDDIMHWTPALRINVSAGAFPDNFVLKVTMVEDRIHHHLDIVTRRRIAVQIDRPRGFEDYLHVKESPRHVKQIGENMGLSVT